jgi:hypothetical protein
MATDPGKARRLANAKRGSSSVENQARYILAALVHEEFTEPFRLGVYDGPESLRAEDETGRRAHRAAARRVR